MHLDDFMTLADLDGTDNLDGALNGAERDFQRRMAALLCTVEWDGWPAPARCYLYDLPCSGGKNPNRPTREREKWVYRILD